MEYKCKTIPAHSLNVSPMGFISPLCDSCGSKDCSNPIESVRFSVIGATREVRLYSRGADYRMVVECEGFLPSK